MKAKILITLALLTAVLAANAMAAGPCAYGGDNGLGYQVGGVIGTAPDADGDGIPNGQDPDYQPPADGTGSRFGRGTGSCALVVDNLVPGFGGYLQRIRHMLGLAAGFGPGDGTGTGDEPKDGTGYGPGPYGDGTCDGDGSGGMWMRMHR
jgi:hypothetical protein